MLLAVDLHIHSCLSPCADPDMTPNNIAAMAGLKGLAAIAVCDHNSCLNAWACIRAGERHGVLVVPGVEATTAEELHALCYFPDYDALRDFCGLLESKQPFFPNNPDLLGEQLILDENDIETGSCSRWLGQAVQLTVEEMERETLARGGVMVPSHINRPSQSLLSNLGFIPPSLKAKVMETKGEYALPAKYRAIRSSDAHNLWDILEDGFPFEAQECSVEAILNGLRTGLF